MKEHVTEKEIAQACRKSRQYINDLAREKNWPFIEQPVQGGKRKLYPFSSLSHDIKQSLRDHWERSLNESGAPREFSLKEEAAKRWAGLPKKARSMAVARRSVLRVGEAYLEKHVEGKDKAKTLASFCKALDEALKLRAKDLMRELGFSEEQATEVAEHVSKISDKTFYRWQEDYRHAEAEHGLGLLGLAPKQRESKGYGSRCFTPDMVAYARMLIVKGDVKLFRETKRVKGIPLTLSKSLLFHRMEIRFGDHAMPHFAHFTKWVDSYLMKEGENLCAVVQPSLWRSLYMPSAGNLSEDVEYAGQRWEEDGTPADVMLRDGRHEVIMAVDLYSRDAIVEVEKHASSLTVAKLKLNGMLRWGVPETITGDRGSIFKSEHMRAACDAMGIHLDLCDAYAPHQKGHVERAIRSMCTMLFEAMTWYVGHDPVQRRQIENYEKFEQVFYHRKGVKISCDATADELRQTINLWLEKVYRQTKHEFADIRLGRSPYIWERLATSPKRAPKVSNVEVLEMLLAPGFERVFDSGVSWENSTYLPASVDAWEKAQKFAQRKVLFRPSLSDISRGGLWERQEDGRIGAFICSVSSEKLGGLPLDEYMKAKKGIEKQHKQRRRAVERLASPPSYEQELADMPDPKVAVGNWGAEEFDGVAYKSATEHGLQRNPTLTDEDRARVARELEELRALNEAARRTEAETVVETGEVEAPRQSQEPGQWETADAMRDADHYEFCLECEAKGVLIPRDHRSRMRFYEESEEYRSLKDYFEKRRAVYATLHRKR